MSKRENPDTIERMKIKVVKRDKELADYDSIKIKKIVVAAGLTEKEADGLCKTIDKWLGKLDKKQVTSLQIRDQVLVEIQKINEQVARKFIWYEKYKDKHYGVDL